MPTNEQPHPYHIHPNYFGGSNANTNAQPGPSGSRRRSSLLPAGETRSPLSEADKFRDAEEEDVRHSGDYDMGKDLLGFHPPPPRNHGYDPLSSPYRPSDPSYSPTRPPLSDGLNSSGYSASSPGRERMPSSTSITSMSSNTGGRRAPAPAALELSPRKERPYTRNPYEGLGHGVPASETRRVATEPILDRVSVLYRGIVIRLMCRCPLEEICDLCRNLPFHQVPGPQIWTSHTNRDHLMFQVGPTSGNRPNHRACQIHLGLERLQLLPCLSVYLFRLLVSVI
jgi:hypothetical protein